jgi:hypothetical protein
MSDVEGQPALARLIAALDRGPLGEVLRDDHRRRAAVYERMADSSDPLTREIGQQLRDGVLRPQDLLKDPEYRRFLDRGVERLHDLDLDELTRQAEAAAADAGEPEEPRPDEDRDAPRGDDPPGYGVRWR